MRIVFDTNVILSALITQGLSSRVFDLCIDHHELLTSPFILDEITDKLENKFHVPVKDIKSTREFLSSILTTVIPKGDIPDTCRDADDNNLLLLADHVHAHLLITGDKDLLALKSYKDTHIISPREFMERYHSTDIQQ